MSSSIQYNQHYDLIVIGSGMGGLTTASLMAQLRQQRVLILERHFKLGGFTHTFKRQGFQWDVGVHYIGQMNPEAMPRKLFDLVTQRGVQWQSMPDIFEKFVYPDLTFAVPSNGDRYQAKLIDAFPHEADAIRQYFRDVAIAMKTFTLHHLQNNSQGLVRLLMRLAKAWFGFDLTLKTQTYLDEHFTDERLKALLASQWLDHGVPPANSLFALHATIVNHYLSGGYYPVGGAETIAQSVQPIVEAADGQVRLNREAIEIIVEKGQAVGVRARNLKSRQPDAVEEYFAPAIVSNVGATNTYLQLLPQEVPIPFRDDLEQYVSQHSPATNVSLYVGFADSPEKLGFHGENHWIYADFKHEPIPQQSDQLLQGQPQHIYMSFPSLKDPEHTKPTAELLSMAEYDAFAPWRSQTWQHRDEHYQELKQQIQQGLIETVEKHYPGFADLVAYAELSTPLTNEHFTNHPQGAIYGLPYSAERLAPQNAAWTKAETPVPGLYLTGADLYMGGIIPALFSGLMTVSQLPEGMPLPLLFFQAGKYAASASRN